MDKPKEQDNMAVVSVGYAEIVLPIEDACNLIRLFSRAKRFETKWNSTGNGGTKYYIGGEMPDIKLTILTADK